MISLHHQVLAPDEMRLVSGALDMKDKPVSSIMTPLTHLYSLCSDSALDERVRQMILDSGYQRIPIHAPGDITHFQGFLLRTQVEMCDNKAGVRLGDLPLLLLQAFDDNLSCLDMLQILQTRNCQMVVLTGVGGAVTGILTMSDLLHELVGKRVGRYRSLSHMSMNGI